MLFRSHRYYLLTVEFGIRTYRTYLEWCDEAERMLKDGADGKMEKGAGGADETSVETEDTVEGAEAEEKGAGCNEK